jgi:hypothetical protein
MKRRLKRRIIWLDEWNIRELENWFSDMSLQGWKLTELGSVCATFEESDPQEIIYRCDVFNVDDQSDQRRIELYRKSGWEFVDSRRYFQVFRESKNGQACEVYTTPMEQAETLSLLQKNIKNRALLMFVLSIFIVIINLTSLQVDPIQNYLEDGFIIPIYSIITYLFVVIHMITGMVHMRKLIKQLKSGEALGKYIDYDGKVSRKKFVSICAGVFVASLMIYFGIEIIKYDKEDWHPEVPQGDLPVVQLSDIMSEREYDQAIIPAYYGPYDNYYKVSSSIFVPQQYELHQSVLVDGSESDRLSIRSYGYELRNEWLAQKFSQTLKDKYSENEPIYEPVSNDKFDGLWVGKEHSYFGFIVRKGSKVYHFIYNGNNLIDEQILLKIEENL